MMFENKWGNNGTLLHLAASNGSASFAEELTHLVDVDVRDRKGQTALRAGVQEGYLEVVRKLVKRGADICRGDKRGRTPLDRAVKSRNDEVRLFMTEYSLLQTRFGEDVNAKLPGEEGWSALQYASEAENVVTMERLVEEGADVNLKGEGGSTPLHAVCGREEGGEEAARWLIDHQADINMQDEYGWTALHWAAYWGNKGLVELLLESGAETDIQDKKGLTPLGRAREEDKKETFLWLYDRATLRTEKDDVMQRMWTGCEEARRGTFVGFPKKLSGLVEQMARAGLYWTKMGDRVKCFQCECWLYNWKPSDDPWARHAHERPRCEFILKGRGG